MYIFFTDLYLKDPSSRGHSLRDSGGVGAIKEDRILVLNIIIMY